MALNDICKLRLESIAAGGDALGRVDTKSVFVEGGAPDETVVCRITEEHKSWARASLLEIVEPSVARVEAACPYYGKCGGCNLQHIKYETQLAVKAAILKDSLSRIGGIEPPEPEIFPSPQFEYRNRMQFHCLRQQAKSGGIKFGLKRRGSQQRSSLETGTDIIAVTDCPIAVPGIRELLRGRGGAVIIPPEKDRFTVFSKDGLLLNEGSQLRKSKITLLGKEIIVDAEVFFQSNVVMLEKLIPELQKIAEGADNSLAMADLYCGVGTFAIFLCDFFAGAVLAEENKKAAAIARENLKGANTEFYALRDSEWPRTLLRKPFGFIVADPPRAGLNPKLIAALTKDRRDTAPPLIAYVSCDPAALARDTRQLISGGYQLNKLMLFDFYPQTSHIETLAVFEKK